MLGCPELMEWSYTEPRYATIPELTYWHVVSFLFNIWWPPPRYDTIPIFQTPFQTLDSSAFDLTDVPGMVLFRGESRIWGESPLVTHSVHSSRRVAAPGLKPLRLPRTPDDNASVLPPTLVQSLPIVRAWSRSLSLFSALVCDLLPRRLFHGSP